MVCKKSASELRYKTNPDEPAYYKQCEDPAYEPIVTEAECKQMNEEFIGGTWGRSDLVGAWPPGCFRHPGVDGQNVYLNTNREGTGSADHVMVCKKSASELRYKTNPDEPAYYKQCEDPAYE